MNTLKIILAKSSENCSTIENLIKTAKRHGIDPMFLDQVAREFDRLRQIEIKAQDVVQNATERTREIDNLAHALRKQP